MVPSLSLPSVFCEKSITGPERDPFAFQGLENARREVFVPVLCRAPTAAPTAASTPAHIGANGALPHRPPGRSARPRTASERLLLPRLSAAARIPPAAHARTRPERSAAQRPHFSGALAMGEELTVGSHPQLRLRGWRSVTARPNGVSTASCAQYPSVTSTAVL